MALSVLCNALSQAVPRGQLASGTVWKLFCKTNARVNYVPAATIVSIHSRDSDYKRAAPFPYKTKKYRLWRRLFESTSERFDENTKIIVVDGPPAVGKTKVAQKLAEDFDMHFIPEANMDMHYINSYGYDFRELDAKLPPGAQSVDEKKWCMSPDKVTSANFQFHMYDLRFSQYIDALAHVFSTGQGVVMVRSVFSDLVFMEACFNEGYVSRKVKDGYYFVRRNTLKELLRPHLVVYLDMPVPAVQQRLKERGHDYEVNGKALTPSFLANLENAYKKNCLPALEQHAELLVYDWSNEADVDLVVEDIERLDFEKYTYYDEKMRDWLFFKEQHIQDLRCKYADYKNDLMQMLNVPLPNCPELYMDATEAAAFEEKYRNSPGNKYMDGFNMDMGDKVFWKFFDNFAKRTYPTSNTRA
ncbi:NADH dehydrogenase [ubiquinone] 1 alpha subcomplex subunit 10, mitochondrial [Nilaparvata lugens]|uniref:NADH dehydrogenase [ubiquinone] 1 alpha subcomplex subunit 10, mitochondrial n=1 Tax=Nilaparvata lugens TaxID=108931 RepID=UPI00193E1F7A|nr:NADH dehydrogenase [ubiquinone] 1 alpha subcomplex subunit 10, mitochondrial [Nilaparvata lugens]